jgi:hypothetical protein
MNVEGMQHTDGYSMPYMVEDDDSEEEMAQKTNLRYGFQCHDERIKQIPTLVTKMLSDIQRLASQYEKPEDIPSLLRLEIRQKISLGIQLELMSIFQPSIVGPNIHILLEKIKAIDYR